MLNLVQLTGNERKSQMFIVAKDLADGKINDIDFRQNMLTKKLVTVDNNGETKQQVILMRKGKVLCWISPLLRQGVGPLIQYASLYRKGFQLLLKSNNSIVLLKKKKVITWLWENAMLSARFV